MIVYTTPGCGKCKILKNKLDQLGIDYEESSNVSKLLDAGFRQAPVLEKDDGERLSFKDALEYVKSMSD